MINNIAVSVVILSYNHEDYIVQAIESVIAQKVNFNYEIIIGDDASQDSTVKILYEYKEKYIDIFNLVTHDKNVGTTRNLCDCLTKCRGEYIIVFGGDDYWIEENKLEIQFEWLNRHSDYIAVGNNIKAMDDNGNTFGIYPNKKLRGKDATIKLFLQGMYYPLNGLMFRNIFIENEHCKYFELITSSRLIEDFSMCMILLDLGKIHIIDKTMAVYRVRNTQNSINATNYNTLRNFLERFNDHVQVYQNNYEFFDGKYDFSKLYTFQAVGVIINCIKTKNYRELKKALNCISIKSRLLLLYYLPKKIIIILLNKFLKLFSKYKKS